MGFKNVSTLPCTLKGYPQVQMVDAMGKSLPTFVTNSPSLMGINVTDQLIAIDPGETAIFNFMYEAGTGYGNAQCPTSSVVQFIPPGATKSLSLRWAIQPYGGATIATLKCGEIRVSPVYLP
jgi:hypothetical protein